MKIKFVAGFSPISTDQSASAAFYQGGIGLGLDLGDESYPYSHSLPGVKHFGIWPLSEAAETCFGQKDWPSHIAVPQATIEFEVDDVAGAEQELIDKGFALLHPTRLEPWGQTTARLLSPEGLLIGVVSTPWLSDS